ncbi:hypothetical protein K435DRAFT_862877 [Dendrothele bispora CBS 962.96]|uniref:Helitron helicase-like domain-containing protein n=1 Tax=Dendrothele bispora (strain CBS 962.96) TaxID=1314807 RepID=A0A4S8LRE5_DENBC|nr:hypothetical protein K435DRAFT_862877 [Dendrothele bispora CBS 962.96]
MESLQRLLHNVNSYVQIYKHAYEILSEHPNAPDLTVCLRVMPGQDRHHYNLPTADEFAAIVPDGSQGIDRRDIILRLRTADADDGAGALQRVNDGHAAYALLHYVLLFPQGKAGWHWGLKLYQLEQEAPKRLSQTHYAAFRLHPHRNEFSTILHPWQYRFTYTGGHDPGPYCNTAGILPHWIIGGDIAIWGGGLWAGLSEPWSTVGIIWLEVASQPDNVIQRITCTCCGHSG